MWHSPSAVHALCVGFLVCGRFPGLAAHINTHYRRHDPQTVLVILFDYGLAPADTFANLIASLGRTGESWNPSG